MLKYGYLLLIFFIYVPDALALRILIDPGHGGDDLGTSVHEKTIKKNETDGDIYEKDIALNIAKLIYQKLLEKKHDVYLTRSFDKNLSLAKRAEIAETLKVDLFISVHVNSAPNQNSGGIETYYLDNSSNLAVQKIEREENKELAENEDPIVSQILADLVVKRTVSSSKLLANFIHKEIGRKVCRRFKMKDRGVKSGLFYVLALSKRPGVLLEVGFLSNQKERDKIMDKRFQEIYAENVMNGIIKFIRQKNKVNSMDSILF